MNIPSHSGFECFPDELIQQILARLPIKSLFRTKCVCKLWYNLTSNNYFIQLYTKVSAKSTWGLIEVTDSSPGSRSSIICIDNSKAVSEFSLDFVGDRVKIRASCNGLLCCCSIPDKGVYYVCNPMTREYKLLPKTREMHVTRFYPDGEAALVGLAGDLSAQKYNVVLAGYDRSSEHRQHRTFVCFVYDSESNEWRKHVSLQDDHFMCTNKNQAVFINGALHWLTESCSCVLVLDLDSDTWRNIQLPNKMQYAIGTRVHLLESDGCLGVIQISEAWMNIWVMKDYEKEEWDVVEKVSLGCIRGVAPGGIFPIRQKGEYVLLATQKQSFGVSEEQQSVEGNVFCEGQLHLAIVVLSTCFSAHTVLLPLI